MPKHNISITLLMPSLEGGGAEKVFVILANALVEQYQSVTMLLASAKGIYLGQLDSRIQVIDLSRNRVILALPKLMRYLRKNRPEILMSGLVHTNLIAVLANLLTGRCTKVIATIHGVTSLSLLPLKNFKSKVIMKCIPRFYPCAERVIAVSKGAAEDIKKITDLNQDNQHVIYNPINFARLSSLSKNEIKHKWFENGDNTPVILSVGRLVEVKNFTLMIEAFINVRKKCNARLLILGEGEQRRTLQKLIDQSGLRNDVDMPGFVENPYPYMVKCKLFVLTSRYESFSMALLEALFLSPQVISTNCFCGPREILDEGRYGTLVPINDHDALVEAIESALDNPQSKPGVEEYLKSKFGVDNIMQQYNNVIKELLDE